MAATFYFFATSLFSLLLESNKQVHLQSNSDACVVDNGGSLDEELELGFSTGGLSSYRAECVLSTFSRNSFSMLCRYIPHP